MNSPNPKVRYPVRDLSQWDELDKCSPSEWAKRVLRNWRLRRRIKPNDGGEVKIVHCASKPLSRRETILICVIRNMAKYVPAFLAHYRRLGVARFAFIDDQSEDGTREMLQQSDVDIFESSIDYRAARGGLIWRDMLVEHYGRDRWYVSVDSDEYLVFPGSENRSITDFIGDLKRRWLKRAMAVMIDIYPDRPLDEALPHIPAEAPPTNFCPLYDGDGYEIDNSPRCKSVRGGPRSRVFGVGIRVNKFPLVYMDRRSQFSGVSSHSPLPIDRNFSAVHAVLLHYKFPAEALDDFRRIAERGSHTGESKDYKAILMHKSSDYSVDLRYSGSVRYKNSDDLVKKGFMQDLRW